MASILRKYGAATTILFPLVDRGAIDFESTPVTFAAGDTQISKDEGAFANTGSNPAHEGNGIYSLALTATEMQAARIVVTVIDSATKTWEDQAVLIETYGNASAQHELDIDVANVAADVQQWRGTQPNVLVSNRVDASVGAMAASVLTASAIASDAITAAKIAANAIGASELAADAVDEIVDQVWDEAQSDHVTAGSFGSRLRELRSGTAGGGTASTIDIGTPANVYLYTIVQILAGTGAGQARVISGDLFNNAIVTPDWTTTPDATSQYIIYPLASVIMSGFQSGAADNLWAHFLKYDIDQAEAAAAIHSLATAILKSVSRVERDGANLKTYETDASTVKMTQTITTDVDNQPIDELSAGT